MCTKYYLTPDLQTDNKHSCYLLNKTHYREWTLAFNISLRGSIPLQIQEKQDNGTWDRDEPWETKPRFLQGHHAWWESFLDAWDAASCVGKTTTITTDFVLCTILHITCFLASLNCSPLLLHFVSPFSPTKKIIEHCSPGRMAAKRRGPTTSIISTIPTIIKQ